MADVKISDMTAAATLDGTEQVELNQGGSTVRTTTAAIRNAGVKVYRALLTQTGTNAPVATVLENTLGGVPVWTRTDTGQYVLTLAGAFLATKTFISAVPSIAQNNNSWGEVDIVRLSDNTVRLVLVEVDLTAPGGSYVDIGSLLNADNMPIQILVYP